MTFQELDKDVCMMIDRLAYQGIKIRKMLLGPEEVIALSQYPGPMVKMEPSDPGYGKRTFYGLEWEPTKTPGITMIHDLNESSMGTYL